MEIDEKQYLARQIEIEEQRISDLTDKVEKMKEYLASLSPKKRTRRKKSR